MTYASLLHDVCDHKYPDSIPYADLEAFIKKQTDEQFTKDILFLIEHVSFSKEDKRRKGLLPKLEIP